jgi:hypothetical protein
LDGMQECADCGHTLRLNVRAAYGKEWRHTDAGQQVVCEQTRNEALRAQREANTGTRYIGNMYPGPPEPLALRRMREQAQAEDEATG